MKILTYLGFRKILLILLVILLLFLFKNEPVFAIMRPDLSGIAVYVEDQVGNRITNATVQITLFDDNNTFLYCDYTDGKKTGTFPAYFSSTSRGVYLLDNVCCTVSAWDISITAPGYQPATLHVDNPWLTGRERSSLLVNDGSYGWGETIKLAPIAPPPTNTPTATPTRTPADKPSPCPPHGDVNGDGSINQRDVDEYNKYIARITPRNFYESAEFADTNGDGIFDTTDRNNIAQFIAGSISTFPVCQGPNPTPTPTPSPTAILTPTSSPSPAPTNIPSAAPSNTPAPTVPPAPTNIPPPTATEIPSSTPILSPTPTLTPTPSFNPDACKCDGIEYTALFSGQPTTITSYGKVEGADTSKAIVRDQSFFLAEGAETIARIIGRSGPIGSVVISSTPEKVRFQSKWTFTLPQLKPGATYRIWSQVNCQPKLQALNYTPARKTVLGTSMPTQSKSFIDRMIEFLNNLFGGGKTATTTSTPTPTSEPGTGTGMILEEPTPTGKKSLQLEPIYPLEVYQKTCSFIKFRNQQFGQ